MVKKTAQEKKEEAIIQSNWDKFAEKTSYEEALNLDCCTGFGVIFAKERLYQEKLTTLLEQYFRERGFKGKFLKSKLQSTLKWIEADQIEIETESYDLMKKQFQTELKEDIDQICELIEVGLTMEDNED